jgi:hypothetical protein
MSRRALLVVAGLLRAIGYASWVLAPSFAGFATGFVLWGLGSALSSGTFEALVYDETVAAGAEEGYGRLVGRAGTVKLVAGAAVTLLAVPLLRIGGFGLVGAVSAAVMVAWSLVAFTLPDRPRVAVADDAGGFRGYLATLRDGVTEAATAPGVRGVLLLAALLPALTSIDEYVPLLGPAYRLPDAAVPLLLLGITLTAAVGNWAAGRWSSAGSGRIALVLAVGGVALLLGGGSGNRAGFAGIAATFGCLQFGIVAANIGLQHAITGPARATVTSLADFGADIGAIGVFATCALVSRHAPVTVLIAGLGVPLVVLAGLARIWLTPPRTGTGSG